MSRYKLFLIGVFVVVWILAAIRPLFRTTGCSRTISSSSSCRSS